MLLSFHGAELLGGADEGLLRRMGRFAAQLFPPDLSATFLASLRTPVLQTLAVAGAGTLLGVVVAAMLGPFASARLMLPVPGEPGRPGAAGLLLRVLYAAVRSVLAVLRGIPEMLWVLLCIVAVGFGPFAGALALGLHTAGVLGKLWAEALDEVPPGPLEVLEAAGATRAVRTLWAAWPQARTLVASYGLLRWEFNLRASALVGFLGGGGLGLQLYNAVQLAFYERVATMVLLILALVVVSDALVGRAPPRLARAHVAPARGPPPDGPAPGARGQETAGPRALRAFSRACAGHCRVHLTWVPAAAGARGPGVPSGSPVAARNARPHPVSAGAPVTTRTAASRHPSSEP